MKEEQTLEDKLVERLTSLSDNERKNLLKQLSKTEPPRFQKYDLDFGGDSVKFLVFSDTHMGHNKYRPDILQHAKANASKQRCKFALIPGDILEGMSGREGHIYELDVVGASAQLAYATDQLSQFNIPLLGITATNSHDGWYSSKNNAGFEVGPELERRLDNFKFLGYDEADVQLDNGIKVRLSHPGDGTAYAISYKMQKYLNALSGGQKPNMVFQGHYHKAMYMFYRNVHAIDCGTLCDQTIFMKKKQTPAHLGYWIIQAWADKKGGVARVRPEFIPFYE